MERLEPQTVGRREAGQAEGALGTLRRTAEHERARERRELAHLGQVKTSRRVPRDHEPVLVLGGRGGQHLDAPPPESGLQPCVHLGLVEPFRARLRVDERQDGAEVLGREVDDALLERGLHDLAGRQVERAPDRITVALEHLCVDLGQRLALGEVDGRNRDRSRVRRGGARPSVRPAGRHHERDRQPSEQQPRAHRQSSPSRGRRVHSAPTGGFFQS